jgi:hypothetical protein
MHKGCGSLAPNTHVVLSDQRARSVRSIPGHGHGVLLRLDGTKLHPESVSDYSDVPALPCLIHLSYHGCAESLTSFLSCASQASSPDLAAVCHGSVRYAGRHRSAGQVLHQVGR